MKKIKKYLEVRENEIIETLREMVERESPSRNKALVDKLCDYLEELFSNVAEVTRIEQNGRRQRVGDELKIEFGQGDKQILVLCHMDTVWEEGEILKRPFTIEDNKIYGPGIFDMKFGIAQIYYALRAFKENNIELGYKVVVYICSHEEIGSRQSIKYFSKEAEKSAVVFVLEPSTQGGLKIHRRGNSVFKIATTGVNAHAGGGHKYGVNAIKELSHQIIEIESLTNYDTGLTVNVGYMKGGRETNVIPDHAEAKFEVRFWTEEQFQEVENILMNFKPKIPGAGVEISLYRKSPPLERTEGNVKLFELAQKVGNKLEIDVYETSIGGLSDANRIAHLKIPTLDGLGAVGVGAHAKIEHIMKDSIVERILLLIGIFIELSKNKLEI